MGSLTSIFAIRVVLGLFTIFPGFVGFIEVADGLPCVSFPTLGLLIFTHGLGEELLGITSGDLLGMS